MSQSSNMLEETKLHQDKHVLLCVDVQENDEKFSQSYDNLTSTFCGRVFYGEDGILWDTIPSDGVFYYCGDVEKISTELVTCAGTRLRIIEGLSYNCPEASRYQFVKIGEVPVNLHNVAVYFRETLQGVQKSGGLFEKMKSEHRYQSLTESNKPNTSFRKGIYLSQIETNEDEGESRFNLLRCSTTLSGPTLNFSENDRAIIQVANNFARENFSHPAEFNHVLAQIYENSKVLRPDNKVKERKARIKSHSDKTKDMPRNGMIAFCTIYSKDVYDYKCSEIDPFDYQYKGTSVLTRLRFRLKDPVGKANLERQFTVVLYPHSILMIPLSTNRLYTHEIVPSAVDIDHIPTRLGYVIRCSSTEAVHRDGTTFIVRDGVESELVRPREVDRAWLKEQYYMENCKEYLISYGDVNFSLNDGDYYIDE